MAHASFQSILSQHWRSQWSVGGVLYPEKEKFCALSAGHGRVGRLAVAYYLASYSYDLLVSNDVDFIF